MVYVSEEIKSIEYLVTEDDGSKKLILTKEDGEFLELSLDLIGTGGGESPTNYWHPQSIAAAVWTITHNLGYKPGGVSSFDSGGAEIKGRIAHVSNDVLTISFFSNGSPVSIGGNAYLS